jgi:hypothetical protein
MRDPKEFDEDYDEKTLLIKAKQDKLNSIIKERASIKQLNDLDDTLSHETKELRREQFIQKIPQPVRNVAGGVRYAAGKAASGAMKVAAGITRDMGNIPKVRVKGSKTPNRSVSSARNVFGDGLNFDSSFGGMMLGSKPPRSSARNVFGDGLNFDSSFGGMMIGSKPTQTSPRKARRKPRKTQKRSQSRVIIIR